MQGLNSVLVEAFVSSYVTERDDYVGGRSVSFDITFASNNNAIPYSRAEFSTVGVVVREPRTFEFCREHLVRGLGVRIVGRLFEDVTLDHLQNTKSEIKILCHSLSFSPMFDSQILTETH